MTQPQTIPCMNRTLADYNSWRIPFYKAGRWVTGQIFKQLFKLHITGKENLPAPSDPVRFMVACNHLSNWDPVLMGNALPHRLIAFIAKRELVEVNPIVTTILDGLGIITIDRSNVSVGSIRSAKTIAQHPTWILGIFPEGTRKKTTAHTETPADDAIEEEGSKRGAAFLARATGCHVLPMGIAYNPHAKPKQAAIHLGPLIEVSKSSEVEPLSAEIMQAIRACESEAQKTVGLKTGS